MRSRRSPGVLVGVATALVVLAGTALIVAARASRAHEADLERLIRAVETLAPRAEPLLHAGSEAADAEIRTWAAASGLRVTLIRPTGEVHADSWTLPAYLGRLENHLGRPEVQAALRQGAGVASRRSITTDRPTAYVARMLGPAGHPAGFLRLADDTRNGSWPWEAVLLALVAGAVAGGLSEARSRRLHRAVAAQLVGWTDLPANADPGAIAAEASSRFAAEREAQSRRLEVLRSALGQVDEGVVLLDRQRVIRLCNSAARSLLSEDLREGRTLLDAVRAPELLAAVDDAVRGGREAHTSLSGRDGAELAVRVAPLPDQELGAAIELRDVAGERRLERARRALVADLAHELRTPLTVLGALAEEMRIDTLDDRLIATIERQVGRLTVFARELEELARIESGQIRLDLTETDVASLARTVLGDLGSQAEKAGVALTLEAEATTLRTDQVRLAQVLTNLVDNAIRYNRPGGTVRVQVAATEAGVRLVVADTGLGIPAADVPLVFQRFYRVRRGSGPEEGSGLGLAIVKHLVHALGGTIQLSSREGEGTVVTITFQASPTP